DAELLLALCVSLRSRAETSPADILERAEFVYGLLENPKELAEDIGDYEYYRGELALIAGGASRLLLRVDETNRWLDRAESHFNQTANRRADAARVRYTRLALAIEERRLEEVKESVPLLAQSFDSMGLTEEALKCRFLEGVALRERGLFAESVEVFREICRQA